MSNIFENTKIQTEIVVESTRDETSGLINHEIESLNIDFSLPPYYVGPFSVVKSIEMFGSIISCNDRRFGSPVCLYVIRHGLFETRTGVRKILDLIRVLKHFKNEYVLGLREIIQQPIDDEGDLRIVLVIDHFVSDLDEFLRKTERTNQVLDEKRIKTFMHQLLSAVECIHLSGHPYRELKPVNVFLKNDGSVLLKPLEDAADPFEYEGDYVITRYYKSPETLTMWENKDHPSQDVWSIGCIMAGMLNLNAGVAQDDGKGKLKRGLRRIFFRGKHYIDQISKIVEVLGSPDLNEHRGHPNAKKFLATLPQSKKKSFRKLFPNASDEAIDFVEKLLIFDPLRRISVQEALRHPFLEDIESNKKKYEEEENQRSSTFQFSNSEDKKEELKKKLLEEISDGYVGGGGERLHAYMMREKEDCLERLEFVLGTENIIISQDKFVIWMKESDHKIQCNRVMMSL